MNGSRAIAPPSDDHAPAPPPRADRPPVGRFLLLFGGLLAAALSLAAWSPDGRESPPAAATESAAAPDAH